MTVSEFVERFLNKVVLDEGSACMIFVGANDGRKGYGRTRIPKEIAHAMNAPGRQVAAHRASFFVFRHPFDPDLQLDHLCHEKRCVNPYHLEVVTSEENALRANDRKRSLSEGDEVEFVSYDPDRWVFFDEDGF